MSKIPRAVLAQLFQQLVIPHAQNQSLIAQPVIDGHTQVFKGGKGIEFFYMPGNRLGHNFRHNV